MRIVVASMLLAACYTPDVADCEYRCAGGVGGECPTGTSCDGDGFCRVGAITSPCSLAPPGCGDGVVDPRTEQCEDGNTESQDGCRMCQWAFCGDGVVRRGVEECDGGAGCTTGCLLCEDPDAYATADGHCYRLTTGTSGMSTWTTARAQCEQELGHLVTLGGPMQASDLRIEFPNANAWIGLYNPTSVVGVRAWVTEEPYIGGNWTAGTINDSAANDCFRLSTGTIDDYPCSDAGAQFAKICEYEPWTIDPPANGGANHAYKVFYSRLLWNDANLGCRSLFGGHLATITSAREQTIVSSISFPEVWIGLTDSAAEGTFKWVTDEALTFTSWAANEPTVDTNKNCVLMKAGAWTTVSCAEVHAVLCEVD